MAELKADVLVLGAGMVGVGAALHLQKRGRDVVLIDRHELAGEETSYGNGGLIECASVFPYMFPRDVGQILRYALLRAPQVRYHFSDLPVFLPWLVRYFLASSPERALHSAMAELPLIQRSLVEHEALIEEANVPELLRRTGWIKLFRSDATLATAVGELERARQHGVAGEILDAAAIAAREPHLTGDFAGAIHFPDARIRAGSRAALPRPMRRCSAARAGAISSATPARWNNPAHAGGWRRWKAPSPRAKSWWRWGRGPIRSLPRSAIRSRFRSSAAIICIMKPSGNAVLHHPVLDADLGYLLAPMNRGIRMTTGVEFARRDAPPTPVQVERALPRAHALFPLGEAVDAKPWMGARPCLPDMLPVIGKAPRHGGLWFDFGHQHHGLTLGPATGRLLAEMMTGETPFADARPFAVERFG